jgi:tetratricopeptide (TPR) repeat protein
MRAGGMPGPEGESADDPLAPALDHLRNLEYDTARQQLEAWLSQHPDDLRALNYLATVLLHQEMFQRGILQEHFYSELGDIIRNEKTAVSADFQRELFGVLEKAQALAENRLKQSSGDQEAIYWAGSAHATRAVFYYSMAKSYLAALHESAAAREYHIRLYKLNPGYVDAQLVIGVNDYVIGSLPWYLKVLGSLAGIHGNRAQGIGEVKRVTEQGRWAREDAKFMLAMLYQREKTYPALLEVLKGLGRSYPRNFLIQRSIAAVYQTQGDWASAAKVYDDMAAKCQAHEPGYTKILASQILYQAGQGHLHAGEITEALARFEGAAKLPGDDLYIYRSELAAADLCVRLHRAPDALRKYQRVADAVPNTEEGRAARRALRKLQESGEVRKKAQAEGNFLAQNSRFDPAALRDFLAGNGEAAGATATIRLYYNIN